MGKFKFFKQRADRLRSWKAARRRQKAATAHESRYCRTRLVTRLLVEGFSSTWFSLLPLLSDPWHYVPRGYSSSVTLPSFGGLMDLWELGNRPCPKYVHWLEMMESIWILDFSGFLLPPFRGPPPPPPLVGPLPPLSKGPPPLLLVQSVHR